MNNKIKNEKFQYNSSSKDFFRLLRIELKLLLSPTNLLLAIAMTAIPFIQVFIPRDFKSQYDVLTIIYRAIVESTTYAFFSRIFIAFREKSALDRNRVTYMLYRKGDIAFARLLGDALLYGFTILIVSIVSPLFLVLGNDNKFNIDLASLYGREFLFLITMMFFFAMIIVLCKWINSYYTANNKSSVAKWLILSTILLFTIILNVVLSISIWIVNDLLIFYADNSTWIAFVPGLNFVIPNLGLYDAVDLWEPLILILESTIFILLVWKSYISSLKSFLTSS